MAIPAQNLTTVGGTALGPGNDTDLGTGKVFTPQAFVDSERYAELCAFESYWQCKQHDKKRTNFDGRVITQITGTQPLIAQERMAAYVPLSQRRPSAPYRLARAIVSAFTNFVMGEDRFPAILVQGDSDSQDFLQTCAKVGDLGQRMVRARNLGGAVGSVGISWAFVDGKPTFQVHNAKNLFVHSWIDRVALIPQEVTECFQIIDEEWNPRTKRVEKVAYWYRRDWTPNSEIVFWPARVDPDGGEPTWVPNTNRSVKHNDNDTHFVWIQNQPSESIDGLPDYDGQYESLDELDTLLSVIVRGAKLNLDPTLVIKEDAIRLARMGIKKGSDNALVVDKEGGDAKYLELSGSSIEAGLKLFQEHRKTILEVAECVIPDPDQVAAAATSAAAIKAIYQRMLAKGGIVQGQYGTGLKQLLEPVLFIAQARVAVPVQVVHEDGSVEEMDQSFKLPQRAEQRDVLGDDNQPTGEKTADMVDRHPGEGVDVELQWPPRFPATPADQAQIVTTASTAVGGKPVMSQQTAVELTMAAFGRDGSDEWAKVQGDMKQDEQKQQQQLQDAAGAAGGQVGAPGQLPPGAKPKMPKPPGAPGEGGEPGAKDQGGDEGGNP